MATIADLATKDTKAGSGRHWRSYTYPQSYGHTPEDGLVQRGYREIWHYSTLMLRYCYVEPYDQDEGEEIPPAWDGNLDTVHVSTGHGSVSDQHGMNQLFRELGIPLRFDRKGGATIRPTEDDVVTGCYQTGGLYTTEGQIR